MGDFAKSTDLPLHYYDTSDHIIYLKSFSMTIFPALRLGTIILPRTLTKSFLNLKKMIDYDTNLIMQKALSLYLDSGLFEKNVTYLKQVFQKQVSKSREVLKQFPNFQHYNISFHGVVLELPENHHLGSLTFTEKINYLDYNYIDMCEKRFIRIPNDDNLQKNLALIADK